MSVFCLSSLLIVLEFRDRRLGSDRQSDASCGLSAQSDISSVPPCGADGVTGRNLSDSVSAPSSSSFINEHVPSQSVLSVDQSVAIFYDNITRSRGVGLRSSCFSGVRDVLVALGRLHGLNFSSDTKQVAGIAGYVRHSIVILSLLP